MQGEGRKGKRTSNACIPCRHSKIKCSGVEPCSNCERRRVQCVFSDGINKVIVAESYLRGLERQLRELKRQTAGQLPPTPTSGPDRAFRCGCAAGNPGGTLRGETSPPPEAMGYARNIWTNPFTLPSATIQNTKHNKRNWIWLAPSSTWSFTARLTIMMSQTLHQVYPEDAPALGGSEIYPLRWTRSAEDEPPDIQDLPSLDYALYLFNIAKFHLGPNYRFFNEERFVSRVSAFYNGDAARIATEDRLWFIQLLLVFAFGKAFRSTSRSIEDPPGAGFFTRAMSLMPDHTSLWKESVVAIEVLALAALYLYSVDQRESAHIYVGQAVRIAQFEGLHTQLPVEQLGVETVSRCRNLWWTLYTMDCHFSSSVGLPMTTQDNDISTPIDPPSTCSHEEVTLNLQVKLSRLLSYTIASVYRSEKMQLGPFLETTRSILHKLAGHAQEMEKIIHDRFQNSVDRTPKGMRHITLLYHQCVMVATRPLLLSVLKERLEKLGHEREDWQDFLALTKKLISIGIKSAEKTLQILSEDNGLLEVFLPYDLEYTYASALHLTIANALFPRALGGQDSSQKAYLILDDMINSGNRVAARRKQELSHLESLLRELATRAELQGLPPLTLSSNQTPDGQYRGDLSDKHHDTTSVASHTPMHSTTLRDDQVSPAPDSSLRGDIEFLNDIGISSLEFYSIVDQIANPDLTYSILDLEFNGQEM